MEKELYGSIITLKNLAIVYRDRPVSADVIFEALMENTTVLKPLYEEMLSLHRSGNYEDAYSYFAEKTGSRAGRNFAIILSKMDKLNPAETIRQIEVFQNMMMEQRMTAAIKAAQRSSVIVTVWAAAGMFALLVNFAAVVVFMDALAMLGQLF